MFECVALYLQVNYFEKLFSSYKSFGVLILCLLQLVAYLVGIANGYKHTFTNWAEMVKGLKFSVHKVGKQKEAVET